MHSHTAYYYNKQQFVTGKAARKLLLVQTREHLDLLQSPEGKHYWYSIRKPLDSTSLDDAIQLAEDNLALLSEGK